jgi:hypothetical protein
MRTHYGPWQPCWISNQHQKHKFSRGPSNEHFWQVWLKSVQRFQRRRFKCEKLTDGRRTLTHDKSSHGLWPGELKKHYTDKKLKMFPHSAISDERVNDCCLMSIRQFCSLWFDPTGTQTHDLPHSLTITEPKQSICDEMNEEHSMKDLEGPGAIDPPILHCFA